MLVALASPSVVAHIIDEQYVKGAPLYRQERQWAKRGVNISRQNMANLVIHADGTDLQVLKEPGKKAESKSYMWLYRSGSYGPGATLYEY